MGGDVRKKMKFNTIFLYEFVDKMDEMYISIDTAKNKGVKDGDFVLYGTLQFIVKIDPKLKGHVLVKLKHVFPPTMNYDFDGDEF